MKYLITTDSYFLAPDGQSYRAVWGELEILNDDFLGIKTNRNSSNWYAKVGNEKNHVIVAGCQIHYAVCSEEEPSKSFHLSEAIHEGRLNVVEEMTKIYIAN